MHQSALTHGERASTGLHQERIRAVIAALREAGAETVLDLGCGPGPLFERLLAEPWLRRIVGVDLSIEALDRLKARLVEHGLPDARASLLHGSFTDRDPRLEGFDAAVLLETLEHVDPERLSQVERAVFVHYRPGLVLITTPNADYNVVHGVPEGRMRHWDHRFEWGRERFARWVDGVARRNGYRAEVRAVGPLHPVYGASTQMAEFRRAPAGSDPRGPGR